MGLGIVDCAKCPDSGSHHLELQKVHQSAIKDALKDNLQLVDNDTPENLLRYLKQTNLYNRLLPTSMSLITYKAINGTLNNKLKRKEDCIGCTFV